MKMKNEGIFSSKEEKFLLVFFLKLRDYFWKRKQSIIIYNKYIIKIPYFKKYDQNGKREKILSFFFSFFSNFLQILENPFFIFLFSNFLFCFVKKFGQVFHFFEYFILKINSFFDFVNNIFGKKVHFLFFCY